MSGDLHLPQLIVERLDGYVNRNSEDGAFTTEILLPQQEEPSSGEAAAPQP